MSVCNVHVWKNVFLHIIYGLVYISISRTVLSMTTEKPTTGKKVNAVQINDLTREVDLKANKKMLHDESETQTHQKISHILNGWHFRGTLQKRRKKKEHI